MADNLGPMAWLLLPENEQVQYLQKIALRAENPYGHKQDTIWTCFIFRTKCDFLSPLRRQFSGLRDWLLKPNVSNPFSPYFFFKEKMGVREKEAENYLMKTTWPSVILKPLQEEDLHP